MINSPLSILNNLIQKTFSKPNFPFAQSKKFYYNTLMHQIKPLLLLLFLTSTIISHSIILSEDTQVKYDTTYITTTYENEPDGLVKTVKRYYNNVIQNISHYYKSNPAGIDLISTLFILGKKHSETKYFNDNPDYLETEKMIFMDDGLHVKVQTFKEKRPDFIKQLSFAPYNSSTKTIETYYYSNPDYKEKQIENYINDNITNIEIIYLNHPMGLSSKYTKYTFNKISEIREHFGYHPEKITKIEHIYKFDEEIIKTHYYKHPENIRLIMKFNKNNKLQREEFHYFKNNDISKKIIFYDETGNIKKILEYDWNNHQIEKTNQPLFNP